VCRSVDLSVTIVNPGKTDEPIETWDVDSGGPKAPFTRYNRLSNPFDNRFDNGFDNRMYRVNGV